MLNVSRSDQIQIEHRPRTRITWQVFLRMSQYYVKIYSGEKVFRLERCITMLYFTEFYVVYLRLSLDNRILKHIYRPDIAARGNQRFELFKPIRFHSTFPW